MDDGHMSPAEGESSAISDDAGLLSGRKAPALVITTASQPPAVYRGRHQTSAHPDDVAEERQYMRDPYLNPDEAYAPRERRASPGPASAVTSLIRRMTTMRSPISGIKFRSTRRSHGGQYANLGEGHDSEQYPVDLSSLEGMGYELHDVAGMRPAQFEDEETEYIPHRAHPAAPSFQDFVAKRKSVGDGMKEIGAELRRNPSQAVRRDPSQSSRDAAAAALDRKKTVRKLGQNLAREKNTIVAVSDVDLSSFEGFQPVSYRSSQTFDTMRVNRSSVMPEETQSYFFPSDPDIPDWKPFSMRFYYIGSLAVLAIVLAVIQEILLQKSLRKSRDRTALISFDKVAEVSTAAFFAWKYLPTMVAIVYAVMFSIMDFDIRRLEPYYQLSQPLGAQASASLNLDHLTMFQYFIPFKAFHLRQWAVFLSTTANILASMVAPALQNPSLQLVTNHDCPEGPPGNYTCPGEQKHYWVRVVPGWSRAVTASYGVITIITAILIVQLRRKSGLLSDPKGIAGIASMATKSHILRDFTGLDQATRGQIHRRLMHRRFVLYKSSVWQGEWSTTEEPEQESESRLSSPHPMMLRKIAAWPFLGFMVFCLGGVIVISLTKARAVPNVAPWLPVLFATVLKLLFTTFEADVRLMEPFYQLSLGNAPPENSLTLDYQATVYGWMPFRAMLNGHWLVALVGFASVALDILTVTVGSFSVDSKDFLHKPGQDNSNQDETFISFWASLVLSLVILAFVIFTTILVYWRRHHPFLPREPSTIAAVLAFIYASNMLTDFIDTEKLTNAQMETRLMGLNKRYGLGWFRGRDGEIHCAIDEEPMKSRYVHGKPYTMAQAGPLQPAETFYSV